MVRARRLLSIAILTFALGCDTTPSPNDTTQDTASPGDVVDLMDTADDTSRGDIGPSGGELSSPDGALKLIVPAGAVTETTTFEISAADQPPPGSAGGAYLLEPEGIEFQRRVVIRVDAEQDRRVATYAPSHGRWVPLRTSWYDATNQHAYAAASHFSMFGTLTPTDGCDCPDAHICVDGQCEALCAGDGCGGDDVDCQLEACPASECDGVVCAAGETCYLGSCYLTCTEATNCSNPDDDCYETIGCTDDPCAGVICPGSKVCHGGTCFPSCGADDECDESIEACYDSQRCASSPCFGVHCPTGQICADGSCFPDCETNADCENPDHVCYDALRCAVDACDGIQCASNETCYSGSCYLTCEDTADCSDPGDLCYDASRCAPNPCEGVECPTDQFCHDGGCFYACSSNEDCDDVNALCWERLGCSDDPCNSVQCSGGQVCYGGACFESCADDLDCSNPDDTCYDATRCASSPCAGVLCPVGQSCLDGACFPDAPTTCSSDADCATGESCLPDSCANDSICVESVGSSGATQGAGAGVMDGEWAVVRPDSCTDAYRPSNHVATVTIDHASGSDTLSGTFRWEATGDAADLQSPSLTSGTFSAGVFLRIDGSNERFILNDCTEASTHVRECRFSDSTTGSVYDAGMLRQ